MREEFLHYLWKTKNIPLNNLTLTDGRKIEINTFGLHNHDSGPDFSNASINIEGIKWIGNIEIHLKSSDWYAHKHQFDKAYDNVILHVVLEHDKDVIINKEAIPTLELKNVIPLSHFEQYAKILSNQKWIPCLDLFNSVESFHIENQVEFATFQRLERKVESISKRFIELKHDLNQLIIENTAAILGTKVNRLPMIELTQAIPSTLYFKESKETQLALIYEIANVFPENSLDAILDSSVLHHVTSFNGFDVKQISKNSLILGNSFPLATISRFTLFVLKIIDGIINKAFKKPQTRKVQFAPCQKPLTRKMINVLRIFFLIPPLLPPKGI